MTERLVIDAYLDSSGLLETMADEVRRGLTASPKTLPSKYFYDARGSDLFEQITELPEYYQTRTEAVLLQGIADSLVARHRFSELVELGSGSATKTRTLLDAMDRGGELELFLPLDVSETILRASSEQLLVQYPRLRVHGVVGDFGRHISRIPARQGRRLVIFLGSTIGNLDPEERHTFLSNVRSLLGPGDGLLLGLDLVKDVQTIEAAYNDAQGVTAAFNLNVLQVVNRGLDGDFEPACFRHRAFYVTELERIEMHLIATSAQRVRLGVLGLDITVRSDESIRTEISCKFTRESASQMCGPAGLQIVDWYTDAQSRFGLALAEPV